MGIPNPTKTSKKQRAQSRDMTRILQHSLLTHAPFDQGKHMQELCSKQCSAQLCKVIKEDSIFTKIMKNLSKFNQRFLNRAMEMGQWLSAIPSQIDGTVLSADEFWDGLALQYGQIPRNLPTCCDSCGAAFTVEHAMSCKKGRSLSNATSTLR